MSFFAEKTKKTVSLPILLTFNRCARHGFRDLIMKKFTLFLAMLLCFGTALKAQTYVGEMNTNLEGFLPGYFTSSGHPYVYDLTRDENHNRYITFYQSDFITPVTSILIDDSFENAIEAEYVDLDNYTELDELVFTQGLFNDDAFFEYFDSERELVHFCDTQYYYDEWYDEESGQWHDTLLMYIDEWDGYRTTALLVKSTNGSTIWTYKPETGTECYLEGIMKFDNKFYMLIREYGENYYEAIHLYLIKQGQGITKVEAPLPLKVFPTLLNRSQEVTVELGEGNNAKEVTVVNNLGQVVKRIPVEEGQRTVTFPARDLRGLNVVNTRSNKGQGSCKIIVK